MKMAVIRLKELKSLQVSELKEKLVTYKKELKEQESIKIRTKRPDNPGKYRELKKVIARIMTLIQIKSKKA
ncbi:50S ribosomal protein L29 [uncultured archaeon]|nr:50S ribosomal protein L29 [uncultured archaeon]